MCNSWYLAVFLFKVWMIKPCENDLLDRSCEVMQFPTDSTEVVHTVGMSCGVGMVIDWR